MLPHNTRRAYHLDLDDEYCISTQPRAEVKNERFSTKMDVELTKLNGLMKDKLSSGFDLF